MRIFISYGRKDATELAFRLSDWLRSQGYDPRLDVRGVCPTGIPFDTAIETEIANSDLLVALLSPSSLRPESFCRNELLYAQFVKRPIIPVRLADLIPPIQIIPLTWVDAFPHLEVAFEKLPPIIEEVLRTGQMPLREWPEARPGGAWWAKHRQLDFREELARYGGTFVGREWLFGRLRAWVAQPRARLMLLTADAGVGKSAIAAQMTARLDAVAGVHFCSRSNINSCRPNAWLSELIYQLAAQFSAYRSEIERFDEPNWGEPPDSLFRTLIADPLRGCRAQLDIQEPWVLVVDGLDESVAVSKPSLADLLVHSAKSVPDWLRVIVTGRPDQDLVASFKINGVECQHLDAEGESNREDLHVYVGRRVEELVAEGVVRDPSETAPRISELAAGNFLFARMTLDALGSPDPGCRLSLDEIGVLPPHLGGLYHAMFARRFPSAHRYKREVLPVLDCLVAARGPVPSDLLSQAAGPDSHTADGALRSLSQFLSHTAVGVRLFHRSLADWLENSQASARFAASMKDGHQRLAGACWQEYQTRAAAMSPYTLSHLPTHLAEADRWDELLQIVACPTLDLLNRWVEGGEGDQGIACLTGLVQHLEKNNRETTAAAGPATQLARIHSLRGQYDEAERWLNQALAKTSWRRGRRVRAIALHELGSLQLYRGRFHATEAERRYRQALRLCRWGIPVYHDEVSANLVGLATVAYRRYAFHKTIRLATRAVREAERASDSRHQIAGQRLTAAAHKILGRYREAESYLLTALTLARSCGSRLEEARLLLLYGNLFYELAVLEEGWPGKAARFFEDALLAASRVHNLYCVVEAQISLGMCALARGATREAEAYFDATEGTIPLDRHPELHAGLVLGRAAVAHQRGKLEAAKELYKNVVNLCQEWDELSPWSKAHVGLGAIEWHAGRREQAQEEWGRALRVARRISPARRELAEYSISLCQIDPSVVPR